MADQDWRFKDFGKSQLPSRPGFTNSQATAHMRAPVTAMSRIIPSPSNTNWNSTFVNNQPTSPSRTDWQKTFGSTNSFASQSAIRAPQSAIQKPFSFGLSPMNDRSSLSLSTTDSQPSTPIIPTSDFSSRLTDADLTPRDHELYGAGPDYGFID